MEERRILVVDDEQMIRESFSEFLERAGYVVHAAGSAEEALEILREKLFMVLFLDLNLPGMSGIELCREIRKNWPAAIAHAVTGYASLYELLDCREAGFEDYFTKPVRLQELVDAAERAFNKLERWKRR